ncbi:hypothetical protein [Streptacidiphilus melanogenes]|uniref:hypothetical protein n=1 Tax=Streptacidiphilus melanogenes TaxID=411235 RepID=UPI00126A6E4C|nr:hypothetical protein [Streptacidiphilus melanogenes]
MTRTRSAGHTVEAYRLDLNEDERQELRSAPGAYLRKMLEDEGHTVDAVLVDAALDDPAWVDTQVVHLLGGFMACTWAVRCVPQT